MPEQPPARRILISSTALDLPEHRRHARDACERMSMLPLVMEQMPASPVDALAESYKLVDQADFYLGIFAFRYGTVPEGQEKSISELEYDRAVKRGIPAFIFIAHDEHPVPFRDVEKGALAEKLAGLKERLKKAHVVSTFGSPEELRTEVLHTLSAYRQDDAAKLHYVAEIPRPPDPWVAHWYSLLGNRPLVGRRDELNLLTDWVARPSSEVYGARLLALVAIGGMGKSALAWHWWNEIAPQEMKPLAGRMWWSFYESDARLENFTARALAYVTGRPRAETEKIPHRDREDQLLGILDREPHLVVLDGLERELVAYARMDAAHLADDDLDAKVAHTIARPAGLLHTAAQSFVGEPKLRQTADPRTGYFLRRLTHVKAARTLVTTRLFPYELHDFNGEPLRGASVLFLRGLSDDESLALWRAAGISSARDTLVPVFRSFEGYPLLVRALAGEIARDRRSPGDFDKWKERHPDFNPFALPLVQRKSHVLAYALQGLSAEELALLRTIAGFRMPAAYETLAALLVGEDRATHPFPSEESFDRALADLDDRALVGWDRRANRYDLHPIVRGVVWGGAGGEDRQALTERMRAHFEDMWTPRYLIGHPPKLEKLDDLAPAIELYASLIRLDRFDEALEIFRGRLNDELMYLEARQERLGLLEMLFPDGTDQPARLKKRSSGQWVLAEIASAYAYYGQPSRAVLCFLCALNDVPIAADVLCGLSDAQRAAGALHAAEVSALRAVKLAREADPEWDGIVRDTALILVGLSSTTRGLADGNVAFRQALQPYRPQIEFIETVYEIEYRANCFLARSALWRNDADAAGQFADRAWHTERRKESIAAARLQGEVAMMLGDLDCADERLQHAFTRARARNHVEEELAILTALAALHLRRRDTSRAREHLDAVWDAAERGPYPLLHADARNVQAEIEAHEGNRDAAVAAATAAYRLAWCDGPPFAYDFGLRTAREHLRALGAPEPELPPYDASQHEPIEEIPIEPEDEQAV